MMEPRVHLVTPCGQYGLRVDPRNLNEGRPEAIVTQPALLPVPIAEYLAVLFLRGRGFIVERPRDLFGSPERPR